MTQLNQLIAVASGLKDRTRTKVTEAYHLIQKEGLLTGISRTYRPRDEDGEQLPPEHKRVQVRSKDVLDSAIDAWTKLIDVIASIDHANTSAAADVVVDGEVILDAVPVTHLLFLEKQLQDVHTFVSKMPVLDEAFDWVWNDAANCYSTPPIEAARQQKTPKPFVKYDATKEHPAQVEVVMEDRLVGYWTKVDFSGAIPLQEKNDMLVRIRKLQDAVKMAREKANSGQITMHLTEGSSIFRYLGLTG